MEKPTLSLIAAMAENRVIGRDNRLPWHLPADLAHFKQVTMGKPMIMGRKTWESLPGLLPGREHIVVSRSPDYHAEGARVAGSLDEAIVLAGRGAEEVLIIGGANLYAQALDRVDRMYLTLIHDQIEGDAWFPAYDERQWRLLAREDHPAHPGQPLGYSFLTLARV